jgi:hypothetical protein
MDRDPEARRRACAAFRVKLRRDTGTNLPAADCEELLDTAFEPAAEGGEQVTLQSNPGRGLHSSTSQLNLSALNGIGGVREGLCIPC